MTVKLKVEKVIGSGHFGGEAKVPPLGLLRRDLVKAKIAKGLDDIAIGRTVSREEFLAEIKERRFKQI
jgi:hypothetical protein